MTDYVRTLPLGSATVTVINVGDITFPLSESMDVPESEWRPAYAEVFEKPLSFGSQCVHIALPDASIVVDAGDYERSFPPSSPFYLQGYQPPPDLLTQLHSRGIEPEDITHLIITHAHFDHYSGVTIERDGQNVPSFPHARCYLGRRDWQQEWLQQSLQDPSTSNSRTLGVLQQAGLLELVDGDYEPHPSVRIIAAPGESPGHQIVRVQVDGQTLYCVGDLYHHAVEVERPDWMASWADKTANFASRQALEKHAPDEDAVLVAAHMPVGRMQRTASGVEWVTI